MAWEDDIYIGHPMGWHTKEFHTVPPCDYMLLDTKESEKDPLFNIRMKNMPRQQLATRERIWENLNDKQ